MRKFLIATTLLAAAADAHAGPICDKLREVRQAVRQAVFCGGRQPAAVPARPCDRPQAFPAVAQAPAVVSAPPAARDCPGGRCPAATITRFSPYK